MTPELAPFDREDPSCLREELAKCRLLLSQCEGQPSLARSLCDTIRGLASEFDKQQARKNLYIHRDMLAQIANAFVQIVAEEISHFPGFESALERIGDRIQGTPIHNSPKALEDLTGRR